MRLTRNKIIIPNKPYITQKLDSSTLSKLLDSSFFVVDGIYKIKQNASSNIQLFEETKVNDHVINAYVKVNYAYAGSARAQVKNVIPWKSLALKRPSYELRISVYAPDQLQVHHFSCKYTNINVLHQDIENQTRILEEELFQIMKQK